MNTFAFPTPQDTLAQMQSTASKAIETSHKLFSAQMSLVQDNASAAFGLAQSALAVRDVDGFKTFATDAGRAIRESFERSSQFVQDLAAQQVAAVQDAGKGARGSKR